MTDWNTLQGRVIRQRNVQTMEQLTRSMCDKAAVDKLLAAMPAKGEVMDDAAYRKIIRAFAAAMKTAAAEKTE